MPRDVKRGDEVESTGVIERIEERSIHEWASWDWTVELRNIILVFEGGIGTTSPPNVNGSVGNHSCITAGGHSTKRVSMVYVKIAGMALYDKPMLVERGNWAGAMKLCNIKCTGLDTWGSYGQLKERKSQG